MPFERSLLDRDGEFEVVEIRRMERGGGCGRRERSEMRSEFPRGPARRTRWDDHGSKTQGGVWPASKESRDVRKVGGSE